MKTYLLKTAEGRVLDIPPMTLDDAQKAQAILAKAGRIVKVFNAFSE